MADAAELIALREKLGLGVTEAAARIGVDATNYRKWEAGTRGIPDDRWPAIVAALETPRAPSAGFSDGARWALAELRERLAALERELQAKETAADRAAAERAAASEGPRSRPRRPQQAGTPRPE